MILSRSRLVSLVAALLLAGVAPVARAQFVWIGASPSSSNFGDPLNWLGGVAPAGLGLDDAQFGILSGPMRNVILVPTSGIHNMTFVTGRPSFTFTAAAGPSAPTITFTGNATVVDGAPVTIDASVNTSLSAGAHIFDIAGPSTMVQFNGAIGGAGSIRKTGTGIFLIFGSAATHLGGTIINGGNLQLNGGSLTHAGANMSVGELGGDVATLSLFNGADVTNSTGRLGGAAGSIGIAAIDGSGSTWTNSSTLFVGEDGTGLLSITGGGTATTANGFVGDSSGATGVVSVSGAGSGLNASSSLTLGYAGSGELTLANGGSTLINSASGTLSLGTLAGGAGTLNIGTHSAGTSTTGGILNAATISTGSGTGIVQFNTNSSSGTPYVFAKVTGAGIAISGSTQVINTNGFNVLIGASTYTGPTYVNGGTLVASDNTAFGLGQLTFSGGSNATARFTTTAPVIGGLAGSASGTTMQFTQDNAILTINQAQLASFNGEFRSSALGDSLRIVKSGPGTLRFDSGGMYFHNGAINGLRGGTEISLAVSQGTLVISNPFFIEDSTPSIWVNGGTLQLDNKTIANPVLVDSGGRLAGNGTFSSLVTIGTGAILAPGASAGMLTFSNGLTLQTGGALEFEVQSASGIAGTGFDTVNVSGGILDLSGVGTGGFLLNLISLNASDLPGNVFNFSTSTSYSWTVFNSPGSITGFSAGKFAINTSAFTNSLGGGSFSLLQSSNQVVLNFTPIPEPSTYALLLAGLAGAAWRLRRRR